MSELQKIIDATPKCGRIAKINEFNESIHLKKALELGPTKNSLTIVGDSPTVSISGKGVLLRNLKIHCCQENGVALKIKPGCIPKMENVEIVGRVEGIAGEEGKWELPKVLELSIMANRITHNRIYLFSPIEGKVRTDHTEFVKCKPGILKAGVNVFQLIIKETFSDSYLSGDLVIESKLNNGLRRVIPFYGHPSKSAKDGAAIFRCESSKLDMNLKLLKNLPRAEQFSPYTCSIDHRKLKCQGLVPTISGLPEGFFYQTVQDKTFIKGVCKKHGNFPLFFTFRKNSLDHKIKTTLTVAKRKIVPLILEPISHPIEAIQSKPITIPMTVLGSNSAKISLTGKLPKGLKINEQDMSIQGQVDRHGLYNFEVEANDGFSRTKLPIKLRVLPQNPLTIQVPGLVECKPGEYVSLKVFVPEADVLKPIITNTSNHDEIILDRKGFLIEAVLTNPGDVTFLIEVTDLYNRSSTVEIIFRCKQPSHTISWQTPSLIPINVSPGNHFQIELTALVDENYYLKPIYSWVGKPPAEFNLSDQGVLTGIVRWKEALPIQVMAEFGGAISIGTFSLSSEQTKSTFIEGTKNLNKSVFGENFNRVTQPNWKKSLKSNLSNGRVGHSYQESLFSEDLNLEGANIFVRKIPPGLECKNSHVLAGSPRVAGEFQLEVFCNQNTDPLPITLKIEEELSPDPKQKRNEETLGKAFKKIN